VSIVTTNVDPAVRAGTPAATSRTCSVAARQIVENDLVQNDVNQAELFKQLSPGMVSYLRARYPLPR
jgi:hypothetical protein